MRRTAEWRGPEAERERRGSRRAAPSRRSVRREPRWWPDAERCAGFGARCVRRAGRAGQVAAGASRSRVGGRRGVGRRHRLTAQAGTPAPAEGTTARPSPPIRCSGSVGSTRSVRTAILVRPTRHASDAAGRLGRPPGPDEGAAESHAGEQPVAECPEPATGPAARAAGDAAEVAASGAAQSEPTTAAGSTPAAPRAAGNSPSPRRSPGARAPRHERAPAGARRPPDREPARARPADLSPAPDSGCAWNRPADPSAIRPRARPSPPRPLHRHQAPGLPEPARANPTRHSTAGRAARRSPAATGCGRA